MTPQQTVTIANQATEVLDNEAFKLAIERMHTSIIQQWENCPVRDKEGQTLILQMKKVAKLFETNLYDMVRAGKDAQNKIDLSKIREKKFDENEPRFGFLRRVNG